METEQEKGILELDPSPGDECTPEPVAELIGRLVAREAEVARLSQQLVEKDDLIGRLNTSLNAAVTAYRGSAVALHHDIPEELIEGESVSAVDESLKKAMSLVARVKSSLRTTAPPVVGVGGRSRSSENMSAEDKIRRGLHR